MLGDKGYQGPDKLPHFDRQFFEIPNCRPDQSLFDKFKDKVQRQDIITSEETLEFASEVKKTLDDGKTLPHMRD